MAAFLIAGATAAAAADEKPVPDGLTCPVEIAGGERISVGDVAPTPGVRALALVLNGEPVEVLDDPLDIARYLAGLPAGWVGGPIAIKANASRSD